MWDFPPEIPVIRIGTLVIDWDRALLYVGDLVVDLSLTERTLLQALANANGRVLTHAWLMDTIWSDRNIFVGSACLRVTVSALRVKLGPERWRLKNVRGLGYKLDVD